MVVEFKQNRSHGCTLSSGQFLIPERGIKLDAINSRYEFNVLRRDTKAHWAIGRTERITNSDPGSRDCMSNRSLDYWTQHALLFTHTCDLLPFLIEQSEFNIRAVTPVMVDSSQLAKLEFDYQPKDTQGDISQLRAGWVLLDPERYWVIVRFEAQVDDSSTGKGSIAGNIEYEKGTAVPIVKKSVLRQKARFLDGKQGEYETRFEFQITEADVPESDFFLSAFGLPEPTFAGPRPTRWYLWVALAGVFCLVLAVLLRRRARRPA
jgi:hypothetical protein